MRQFKVWCRGLKVQGSLRYVHVVGVWRHEHLKMCCRNMKIWDSLRYVQKFNTCCKNWKIYKSSVVGTWRYETTMAMTV